MSSLITDKRIVTGLLLGFVTRASDKSEITIKSWKAGQSTPNFPSPGVCIQTEQDSAKHGAKPCQIGNHDSVLF